MTRKQRQQYEVFVKMREFEATHLRERIPVGSAASEALGVVGAVMAQIEASASSTVNAATRPVMAKALSRKTLRQQVGNIVRTARAMALTNPEAASRFRLQHRVSDVSLLNAARMFSAEAEPMKAVFIHHGMPPTFLEGLQHAVDAFEASRRSRHSGTMETSAATLRLKKAVATGRRAAHALDLIMPNLLSDAPELLTTWKQIRRMEREPAGVPEPAAASSAETATTVAASETLRQAS